MRGPVMCDDIYTRASEGVQCKNNGLLSAGFNKKTRSRMWMRGTGRVFCLTKSVARNSFLLTLGELPCEIRWLRVGLTLTP